MNQEITVSDLLNIFLRHIRLFIGVALGIFLLAAVFCLLVTHRYKAVGIVSVESSSMSDLSPDSLMGQQSSSSDAMLADINVQTQAGVLASDVLAVRTIQALHLEDSSDFKPRFPDAIGWVESWFSAPVTPEQRNASRLSEAVRIFHKRLKIKPEPGTRLIDVSFASNDAKTAAEVVNTIVSESITYGFESRLKATRDASKTLSQQLADLRENSDKLERRAEMLQQHTGVYSTGTTDAQGNEQGYSSIVDQLQRATIALNDAEQSRILRQAINQVAQTGDAELLSSLAGNTVAGSAPSSVTNSLATIQLLRSQLAQLTAQLDQLKVKFGPNYPERREIEGSILGLQQSIHNETNRIRERANNDYLVANQNYIAAQTNYDRLKAQASTLNDKSSAYLLAKQEADSSRALYEDLLRRLREAGVLEELRADDVLLVDPAMVPTRKTQPPFSLVLAGGSLGGLLLGFLAVLLANIFDDRVHDAQYAVGRGYPLLGMLPPVDIASSEDPQIILQRILASSPRTSNVILFASAVADADQAVYVDQLAKAAAMLGYRTLIIECDLRKPSIAARAGVSTSQGLTGVLRGTCLPEQTTMPWSGIERLTLLPAGAPVANPAGLLSKPQFSDLIAKAREEYQIVLLAGPPVSVAAGDIIVLSKQADYAIEAVRVGKTSETAATRAYETLSLALAADTGLVLTDVPIRARIRRDFYGADKPYSSEAEIEYENA